MKFINYKSRGYDWLIVGVFFVSFFSFLFHTIISIILGLLLAAGGLWIIRFQEKKLKTKKTSKKIQYAGFEKRLCSLIVDGAVFSSLFLILFLILQKNVYDYLVHAFYSLFCLGITLTTLKRWSQTPGKMVMGIQVLKTDFSPIAWKQILIRQILEALTDLWYLAKALLITSGIMTPGLLLVGAQDQNNFLSDVLKIIGTKLPILFSIWFFSEIIILLTNHKKRALHDYLAGTVVVVKRKSTPRWAHGVLIASFFAFLGQFYFQFSHKNLMMEAFAAQGDPSYEELLGDDYYYGRGGYPQDYAQAYQWFEKAAVQGNVLAQFTLGEIYKKGLGVQVDKGKAIQWYTRAFQNDQFDMKSEAKLNLEFLGAPILSPTPLPLPDNK